MYEVRWIVALTFRLWQGHNFVVDLGYFYQSCLLPLQPKFFWFVMVASRLALLHQFRN